MLGESLELLKGSQASCHVCWGMRDISGTNAGDSDLPHSEGGHLMVYLELRWEPGVSSRVTTGMFFKHSCFLSDIRTPV